MLTIDLGALNASDVHQWCLDRSPESSTLEFKRDLPGRADADKHELLKDVSAMANADGGDLVYGIQEVNGAADTLAPISGETADAAQRRVRQVLDSGLEPRVQGIDLRIIDVPGGYVLVLRVPASFDGPHCIRVNHNRRFVVRNGTGIADMNFEQIRSAFDRTATLASRAAVFIQQRQEEIASPKTKMPLREHGPIVTTHLVPLAGLAGRRAVDLREVYNKTWVDLKADDWGGSTRGFTFDGITIHPGSRDHRYDCFVRVFRTGAMEAVDIGGQIRKGEDGDQDDRIVWALSMAEFYRLFTKKFLVAAKSWGHSGPALLSIGLLKVEGWELGVASSYPPRKVRADRPQLVPESTWIENIQDVNVDDILRSSLDSIWQAFGWERCLYFDDKTGAYQPPR